RAQDQPIMPETVNGRPIDLILPIVGVFPANAERKDIRPHRAKNYERAQPLKPAGLVGHNHAGGTLARFGALLRHHAPFFRQTRTSSSTDACTPRTAWAPRTASWASICLKPSATRASTALLM